MQVKATLGPRSASSLEALDVAASLSQHPAEFVELGGVELDGAALAPALAPAPAELLDEAVQGFIKSNVSPEATRKLGATDPMTINLVITGIIALVVFATAIGMQFGDRTWIAAMVCASYMVLIPGLFTKDFSFNIAALIPDYIPMVGGTRYQITSPQGHKGPIRESTRSLVPLLWKTGSHNGALLIFIFAFIVPFAKLALLALGEAWRHSPEPSKVRWARRCITWVQVVSKWASPDMYAFMLLYYLLRSVNSPPFLESIQVLDVGFACYNVFCVFSVISAMSVTLPVPIDEAPAAPLLQGSPPSGSRWSPPKVAPKYLWLVALAVAVGWSMFFVVGVFAPCMSLHLNSEVLVKALDLPSSMDGLVASLGLEDLIGSEVTLWKATNMFWSWFKESSELNLLLSTAMLGGFGLALPVADVLLLVVVAFMVSWPAAEGSRWHCSSTLLKWTHSLKHLAMLDVCTAGVVVVSYAAGIYKEQGLVIKLERGIFVLAASEVLHSLLYYTVHHAAQTTVEVVEK